MPVTAATSLTTDADALRRLEDLGVVRALIPPPTYDPSQIGPALAAFTTSFAVKAA